MPHSPLFTRVGRIVGAGEYCARNGLTAREGLDRLARLAHQAERQRWTRRQLLGALGVGVAGAAAFGALRPRPSIAAGGSSSSSARVAIVGAGLAGLACVDRLETAGIVPVLYEANPRVGGRIRSYRGFPVDQVVEAGGEMIDNLHKTVLGFANELGLTREDLGKAPGDPLYHFFDSLWTEEDVVDEYRQMVANMRPDLQACSGAPTFFDHTLADVELDSTDLQTYLDTRAAGLPLIRALLAEAYVAEYGLECSEQSCLNMLLFLHLDNSSKLREFGVFSDERYHVVEGNDRVTEGLADRLSAPINTGARLTRLGRNASGEYELYFNGSTTPERADAVVLTLPFAVLRRIQLDDSLGLSADKKRAIADLGYGNNCKTAILFEGRPWADLAGGSGLVYSDRPNLQNTWETSWTTSTGAGVLTDYASGDRGRALQVVGTGSYCGSCHVGTISDLVIDETLIQQQVEDFLADLDIVIPGARAQAVRIDGKVLAHRGHWLSQSASRGSYTCYKPGQFTAVAGLEGQAAGLLKFAGEHANSFYEWQGFMEGAALSGIDAAEEVLADIRDGLI